jgi:hypothetical protein
MEWLMLATGVSGAFTLVWLFGIVQSWLVRQPVFQVQAGPGILDLVLRDLAMARREILLCTDMLENPGVVEALLAARERKVNVEVLHGAVAEVYSGSTLGLFLGQQIVPLIDDHASRLACHCFLIDGQTLLLASGPFHPEEEQSAGGAYVLRVQHVPEVIGAFREILSGLRTRSRPARPTQSPGVAVTVPPTMTAPAVASPAMVSLAEAAVEPNVPPSWAEESYHHPESVAWAASQETSQEAQELSESLSPQSTTDTRPVPAARSDWQGMADCSPQTLSPPVEPFVEAPVPTTTSLLSRPLATYEAPASERDELSQRLPRAVRKPILLEDEHEATTPAEASQPPVLTTAPPVTQAAAELFARLRREVQARGNSPIAPREPPPSASPAE